MKHQKLPTVEGCYNVLIATIQQARRDAKRSPEAAQFLQQIGAPLDIKPRANRLVYNRKQESKTR